jgi:hypothetical protein
MHAQVRHGRLVIDDETRAQLHAAIDEALAEPDDDGIDAADLIAELRSPA